MTYPLVQFVESPDPGAAVRFDFNDDGLDAKREVLADGFTLGSPTLEGEPDAVGVSYGFRQPSFVLQIRGAKPDALATLSELSRELLRQTNWLCVTLDEFEQPIWLKTYQSPSSALSLDRVYVDSGNEDTWAIQVTLAADPFLYGERDTLDAVTIAQAPDGTNPMRYVLPTIKGDAPTPLQVRVTPTGTQNSGVDCSWMIGCIAGSASMEDLVFDIGTGDGFSGGTGTSAPVANADYFGGEYRTVTIAAATPNLIDRTGGDLPVVPPGRYKVKLRCEIDSTGASGELTYLFRLKQAAGGSTADGPTATAQVGSGTVASPGPAATNQLWVDLGEFTFPFQLDTTVISRLKPSIAIPNPSIILQMGTATGAAGTARIDALKLIPIDGPMVTRATILEAKFSTNPLQTNVDAYFDGDDEIYMSIQTGTVPNEFLDGAPSITGAFPVADPAAEQNLLLVMALDRGNDAGSSPWVTTLAADSSVQVSYHPRYLHLGDGT